jgi:CRP-like cAMP-binding protein
LFAGLRRQSYALPVARAVKITPTEVKAFLRGVDLFDMLLDRILDRVVEAGTVERLPRGATLFKKGDPADRMHVVLSGAIEIARATSEFAEDVPVAYLTPGETIGDMAILTGTVRRSTGRVPESAEVWTLSRAAFERLATEIPGYCLQIARVFARRMERLITHMRREESQKELAGKLIHFDMPTVIQTLISSNQSGVLTILDEREETLAEVLLLGGTVHRARCGRLEGEDAFYEILLNDEEGEFRFRTESDPQPDLISREPINVAAMSLLMEAMRRKDELPTVQARLPGLDREYRRVKPGLEWSDPETEELANQILEHLRQPMPLEQLAEWVVCSTYTLYEIAAELYDSGQIR